MRYNNLKLSAMFFFLALGLTGLKAQETVPSSLGSQTDSKAVVNTNFNSSVLEKLKSLKVSGEIMDEAYKILGIEIELASSISSKPMNRQNLKSAVNQKISLDSLIVDRWNETTAQIEQSKLERFTWNDKGQGETWELYDWDLALEKWIPNNKEEYTWDEFGNLNVHINYILNPITGKWLAYEKKVFSYDNSGNELYFEMFSWDSFKMEWFTIGTRTTNFHDDGISYTTKETGLDTVSNEQIDFALIKVLYDSNKNPFEGSVSQWDIEQNAWILAFATKFAYDDNGNVIINIIELNFFGFLLSAKDESKYNSQNELVELITSQKDLSTGLYVNDEKKEYTYANDTLVTTLRYSEWNETVGEWELYNGNNYFYNEENVLQYTVVLEMDTISNSLVFHSRKEYVYDEAGVTETQFNTLWDPITEQWIPEDKVEFTRNAENQLTYQSAFSWDSLSNNWIAINASHNDYDTNGNLIKYLLQYIDDSTNILTDFERYDYSYDETVWFADLIYPGASEYERYSNLNSLPQYPNMMLTQTFSERKDNELVATEIFTFFYSEGEHTSIPKFATENKLKVYPNPASEYVQFEINNSLESCTVEVYNMAGNKVIIKQLTDNKQLNVSQLKAGLYIYKVIQGTKAYKGKFMVS